MAPESTAAAQLARLDVVAAAGAIAPPVDDDLAPLSLDQLTARYRAADGEFRAVGRRSLELAYRLGEVLAAVRTRAGRGKWLGWCANESVEARTAQRYIRFRASVGDRARLTSLPADTSVRGAMALLQERKESSPAVPARVFPVALPEHVQIRQLDAAAPPPQWRGTVDLIVTSWPYCLGITERGYVDHTDYAAYMEDCALWAAAARSLVAPNGRLALVVPLDTASKTTRPLYADVVRVLLAAGWTYQTSILWTKGERGQIGKSTARGSIHPRATPNAPYVLTGVEMVVVCHVGSWNLGRKSDESDLERAEAISWTNGVWNIGTRGDREYPCVFPDELARRLVKLYSFPGATVADLHVGSGTTAVAAAQLGRRFVGGDRNPYAVALAAQRALEAIKAGPKAAA